MEIWALSGFLGLPQDWNLLQLKNLVAVDWQAFAWKDLADWGTTFNCWVHQQQSPHSKILMGYSLGGRLALHALINQPQLWQAAIIVSAHAGLTNPEERQKRQQHDRNWAKRFESEDWTSLMKAWEVQPIFAQDSFHFERKEVDYQRDALVKALIQGSLGNQSDLRSQIANLQIPILWVTGENDPRFCQVAQSLTFAHPHSSWQTIPQAGHRVPWVQPQAFFKLVTAFLHSNLC
jgi:2-succinyl-6-hydroxy-2,4-cyclohexadiene-1-carboxylate synthase